MSGQKVGVLLLAAGRSRRMGGSMNKVYEQYADKPVLVHCLSTLADWGRVDALVVVAAPDELELARQMLHQFASGTWGVCPSWSWERVVAGGEERQHSVANGLAALPEWCNWVVVHDGARPAASARLFDTVLEAAFRHGNAIAAVPVTDTIKHVQNDGRIMSTPNRSTLWAAQTPQIFRRSDLEHAHRRAEQDGVLGTDDAELVERVQRPVHVVHGERTNVKMTYPSDRVFFGVDEVPTTQRDGERSEVWRIGFGYDIHRLEAGRPCILCGVHIPSPFGPIGHSDADVPAHALTDALLGAAGMRDIGTYFPDDDPQYKDADSMALLERVVEMLADRGWRPVNVDLTIVAERPTLKPYVEEMVQRVSNVLHVTPRQVGIKATTNEGVGDIGRGMAIAAYAVVQLRRSDNG